MACNPANLATAGYALAPNLRLDGAFGKARQLLSVNADAKTRKGVSVGYLTGILYLAPADLSGYEVCPMRSDGCTKVCLFTAGRGAFNSVIISRIAKTKLYFEDRPFFMFSLRKNVDALIRKAEREALIPVVRLNGTSDIVWEKVHADLFTDYPDIQWYDYTKRPNRVTPANYHLTFSRSESNQDYVASELARGMNVAVVFDTQKGQALPSSYLGFRVFDADKNDLRFLDPRGIAGLRSKGKAKKDDSGFVVQTT